MKSWKALELKIAKDLGTNRTPLSGFLSRITSGDVIHDTLYVEVKQRASFSVVALFNKTKLLASKEGRLPVLVLKEKGRHGEVAVIDWKFFLELWREHEQRDRKI